MEAGEDVLWVGMAPLGETVSDCPECQARIDRRASTADGVIVMYEPDPAGVVRPVEIPNPLRDFAVNGPTLWAVSSESGHLYRVETDTGVIGGEIALSLELPARPLAVAVDGDQVWVSLDDGTLAVVDGVQGEVVDVIDVDGEASGLAVGGGLVWALQASERALVAIDAAGHDVVDEFEVGRRPSEVEWAGGYAWVSNMGDDTVTRISASPDS
jgi:DNA-binding beta-propeller fold protein YncE